MPEERILQILNEWFESISEPSQALRQYANQTGRTIPFDRVAVVDNMPFYIAFSESKTIPLNYTQSTLRNMSDLVRFRVIEQAPVLIATLEGNKCQFGFLIYWDFDKCYTNHHINWRNLDDETFCWLKIQLKARRQRIAQLPENYIRVIKTIQLNSKDLVDGEIIYLRKFNAAENYVMKTSPELTNQDRFNRLLTGTPEDEYPDDKLDRLILANIQTAYPEATKYSKVLLFDVDLLDFRHKKDKRMERYSIYCVSIKHDGFGNILGQGNADFKIDLEMYYYPNVFKQFRMHLNDRLLHLDSNLAEQYKRQLPTYNPFSYINI